MEIRENVILAPYTTFRIGGPARYFCEVGNLGDLRSALKFSKDNNLRFFILGGGSNILVSDKGFDGLVIKMGIRGLEFKDFGNYTIVSAGAGESWDYVVERAVKINLGGIENLSLIPGTAGAAVYQNIGAYGVELKDVLESAEVLNVDSGEIKIFSNEDCLFGYRNSVFKINKDRNSIILKVNLKLYKNQEPKISYPDLIKIFEGKKPSIAYVRVAVIEVRMNKIPYPPNIMPQILKNKGHLPNAGSFFKNPIVTAEHFKRITLNHSDLKGFKLKDGTVKLFVAQLIEKYGWKGKRFGNVGVSEKHSLVLVNYGDGTAEEVTNIADNITKSIKNGFGLDLEPEVETI